MNNNYYINFPTYDFLNERGLIKNKMNNIFLCKSLKNYEEKQKRNYMHQFLDTLNIK